MTQVQEISPNAQQIEYWNATAGDTWAQFQEPLDRQVEPLGQAAIDVLDPAKGEHIIDIGLLLLFGLRAGGQRLYHFG